METLARLRRLRNDSEDEQNINFQTNIETERQKIGIRSESN